MSEEQIMAFLNQIPTHVLAFTLGWIGGVVSGILAYRSGFERSFMRKFYESQGLKYRG